MAEPAAANVVGAGNSGGAMSSELAAQGSLEPLDQVVNLYRVFRADGETTVNAWRWACRIAAALEQLSFQEAVEADLASLVTL